MKFIFVLITAAALLHNAQAATPAATAPDLDLQISYYSKVVTPEGVTREARYQEKMLRRPGHVWVARRLAKTLPEAQAQASEHKHFNPVVIPRHVLLENKKLRLEYLDAHAQQVIAILPSEYDNVSFDGSWENSFYLLDPKLVSAMPLSSRRSAVTTAEWREREKNGVFQRVLWDSQKQIALIIESGDQAGTFYRRVEVTALAGLTRAMPWKNLKGFAQKEYADFLD